MYVCRCDMLLHMISTNNKKYTYNTTFVDNFLDNATIFPDYFSYQNSWNLYRFFTVFQHRSSFFNSFMRLRLKKCIYSKLYIYQFNIYIFSDIKDSKNFLKTIYLNIINIKIIIITSPYILNVHEFSSNSIFVMPSTFRAC